MIVFKLTNDGAFLAGDTETGRTAYAYPTSDHAFAARKHPQKVANEMMRNENAYRAEWRDIERYKRADAKRLSQIMEGCA